MNPLEAIGTWAPSSEAPVFSSTGLAAATHRFREPTHVLRDPQSGAMGVAFGGQVSMDASTAGAIGWMGRLPAVFPEWLGDRTFCEFHRLRFPYVTGEMANGIATTGMVIAMAKAGMLGFFGAAGLSPERVVRAIDELETALGSDGSAPSWGINLIHSPAEPALENAIANLFIERGVQRICVSAFMGLTPAVVRLFATGLTRAADGRVLRRHHLFAKISRPEVAEAFMQPAPAAMLKALVQSGQLRADEAALGSQLPVAGDITIESDSGGHTDNRPLGSLFPTIARLRDALALRQPTPYPIRLGAAGGLGTPESVAAAFALGAAYVVTGSINQSAVEAGIGTDSKTLLAQAGLADVIMAPAADMFELGVKVQVLRRGTLFGPRALKLYDAYRSHDAIESMSEPVRLKLEKEVLGASCDEIWREVQSFFSERDPEELQRAEAEPKHRMALVFRWYLGLSSRWAIANDPKRRADYQIWCGPAMGAFNAWVRGTFLEAPAERTVVQMALNLLEGAAAVTRAQQMRSAGLPVPGSAFQFPPRRLV
ncbi:MAG: PfaD family polyunsaturated fatty acid/polyketide biosynthesis protein [Deltaproteobacteria bacterium]|nr:PfaD family polyunsaturated fatty acid/polyketide biosynthesis protein [Deltaproteobacteria bacterium]